jgi:hypothetical protein
MPITGSRIGSLLPDSVRVALSSAIWFPDVVVFSTWWLLVLLPSPIFQRGIWTLHECGSPALRGEREVGCSGGLVAPLGHHG